MATNDDYLIDDQNEFRDAFDQSQVTLPAAPTGNEYLDAFSAATNEGTVHLSQLNPAAFQNIWQRYKKAILENVLWNMLYVKFPKPLMGERMWKMENYKWTGKEDPDTIAEKGVIPPSWYQQAPQEVIRDVLPNPLEVGDTKSLITPEKWKAMKARITKPRMI